MKLEATAESAARQPISAAGTPERCAIPTALQLPLFGELFNVDDATLEGVYVHFSGEILRTII